MNPLLQILFGSVVRSNVWVWVPYFLRRADFMVVRETCGGEELSIAGDHIVGGYREGSLGRTVVKQIEVSLGCGDVGPRAVHGIGNRAEFFHQTNEPP